jgi:hypothetical protein
MIRNSLAKSANPTVNDWTDRYADKSNLEFFTDALAALRDDVDGDGGRMTIGLVGSRNLPANGLRHAQSYLRWDHRPSLWSHAFLITGSTKDTTIESLPIREVTLHPRTGEFPPPETNAVVDGTLGLYGDARLDANVALIAVSMKPDEVDKVAERAADPNRDRLRFNLWETLGVWQAFIWSAGTRSNPLRDGHPIPSASFVEYCFEAINVDITPGASERNSAPEHVWNAVKWWAEAYDSQSRTVHAYFVHRDDGASMLDAGTTPPPQTPPRPSAPRPTRPRAAPSGAAQRRPRKK